MRGRGKHVEVMKFTNLRTKEAQETRDAAMDAGRVPILPHHDERARGMVAAGMEQLSRHIEFYGDWKGADGEVVIVCQWDGLWVRSMVDKLSDNRRRGFDYKTAR